MGNYVVKDEVKSAAAIAPQTPKGYDTNLITFIGWASILALIGIGCLCLFFRRCIGTWKSWLTKQMQSLQSTAFEAARKSFRRKQTAETSQNEDV